MRRKNYFKLPIIVFILFLVIGFALLSTTLNINGTSTFAASTWNIHWENVVVNDLSTGVAELPEITDDDTVLSYDVQLELPGDFYEFTVDAKNDGTIDATIEDIQHELIVDEEFEDYVAYSIVYDEDGSDPAIGDVLAAGDSKTYRIRIEFLSTATSVPSNDLVIHINDEILYGQTSEVAPVKYTVTFNANGGSVSPSSKEINAGRSVGSLPIPSYEGYIFAGWYTDITAGDEIDEDVIPEGDVTYYAHWSDAVAKNIVDGNTTYYISVQEALDGSDSGTTYLLKDSTENTQVADTANKTLDLNGKTLTGRLLNNGVLVVTGNGTMQNSSSNVFINNNRITVENGTYTCNHASVGTVSNKGDFIINGGTFIAVNANTFTNYENCTITVNGGTLQQNKTTGNQVFYNSGILNITGGTISTQRKVIHNLATGVVNVSGGLLENSAANGSNIVSNLGELNVSGDAVLSANCSNYATISNQAGSKFSMSGGTISGYHIVLNIYDNSINNVTGGSIIGKSTSSNYVVKVASGGTFNMSNANIKYQASGTGGCLRVESGGNATIRSGSLWNDSTSAGNVIYAAGNVELSGGSFVQESNTVAAIHVYSTGTLNVSDGNISATKSDAMGVYSEGNLIISGGTFSSSYYSVFVVSGTKTITGGTFYGPTHNI